MKKIGSTTRQIGRARVYSRRGVQKFARQNPKAFSLIRKAIETKDISWESPTVISKEPPITIQRAATGKFSGSVNYNRNLFGKRFGTFRLTIRGKSYFLKYSASLMANLIERHKETRKLLREQNHRIGNVNVRLVEPHIILLSGKPANPKPAISPGFLVTRFFEEHQVTQIPEANPNKTFDLKQVSKTLQQMLQEKGISREMRLCNLFYEEKTNTLWVYDL